MKIAIITSRYPTEEEPYRHMFVHVRALYFKRQGIDVSILVPSKENKNYIYDGIKVIADTSKELSTTLKNFDVLYLHLLNLFPVSNGGFRIYRNIIKHNYNVVIYVHGSDVLTYPDYFFDFNWSIRSVFRYVYYNTWKKHYIKKFLTHLTNQSSNRILMPSKWLGKQIEKIYTISEKNFSVIPNGIDLELFCENKTFKNRYKILCIRPLDPNYPLEDVINLMTYLPEKFSLDIYGNGPEKNNLLQLIHSKDLSSRVKIIGDFIPRESLNNLLKNYGIFNALSKLDTQGVMMCEAMASQLLVISSNKTAIPEFITDNYSGILDNELPLLAKRIISITADQETFEVIVQNARNSMNEINWKKTGEKELDFLKKTIAR